MERWIVRLLWCALLTYLPLDGSLAAEQCESSIAKLVSAQGRVEVKRVGDAAWKPVEVNESFCRGDGLRAEELSRAALRLPNGILLRLDQGTAITLSGVETSKPSWLDLLKGTVHFLSRVPYSLKIKTPFVNALIEGTEFVVRVEPAETGIWVFDGTVLANNEAGGLRLHSGQAAIAQATQPPLPRLVIRPRDAVQGALYYPPIIDYRPDAYGTGPGLRAIRDALALYQEGNALGAITKLEQVPANARDTRYFDLRAGLVLSVGRVDEAQQDLSRALELSPGDGIAFALQSLIAVVQNDKDTALGLAQRAVEAEPRSPVPRIALSYVHQARFDIEQALASARESVRLAPESALGWTRVAELELSLGEQARALEAARRAVALNPNLARTHTVLGFASLTKMDSKAAKAAFAKAMQLDAADPLSRLGMGLAEIREGELTRGTQAIEEAAILDPSNSLTRSYLGKAYFEDKREALAAREYGTAKEVDPKEPTPWFYDAILKQTTNRPIEALQDLRKSIELNDDRVVYRSRLLLDQDLATRGTSLARIYSDLGFEQPALVEASKSLSLDPGNHSAHRFLSDEYAGLPRHEIARVSELLQAQLLQPINVDPIQPRLETSDINVVAGASPAQASFNEFTPLYERNRPHLVTSLFGGSNHTWGDELVLSGLHDRFAYSFGQFHSDTGGFRENNDDTNNLYNAFLQFSVTPSFTVQTEYRRRETDQGDLVLKFDPNDFSRRNRRVVEEDTGRFGAHLAVSRQSDFLLSVVYDKRAEVQRFLSTVLARTPSGDIVPRELSAKLGDFSKGYQIEGQYLFRSDRFNVTLGGGTYRNEQDSSFESLGINTPLPSSTHRQETAYLYSNLRWPRDVIWTAGFSYDSYGGSGVDLVDSARPKLGLQWNVTEDTHLRLAYLQTVKRILTVDQSIEPTQVAGFNQFFDDFNGTRADLYGIGLDTRFTQNLNGGVQASRRDLATPLKRTIPQQVFEEQEHREDAYQAYLNWAFAERWAVTAQFRFDRFRLGNRVIPTTPTRVDTPSVPITLRYFSPSGLFAKAGVTYVHQDVELTPSSSFKQDSEAFVVVDAAIGYRLPRRAGILSLEATNLLDAKFLYQDDNFRTSEQRNPRYVPDQVILARITLNF